MKYLAELVPTVIEVCRVVSVLAQVERERCRDDVRSLVTSLRKQGRSALARGSLGRRSLRRAIRWVDRWMPDGGNCYRRALLEIALDRRAAADPLFLGFNVADEQLRGHAWLHEPGAESTFPFTVRI